ncbi:MAG: hypothetical protein Q9P01_20450 [Anaerolineae bacterium]|nr:hypothetical protein [Anaerolineae bacterium]
MTEQQHSKNRLYRIWIALFGGLIVIGGLASELLSYSPGYGAYQIWIIVLGFLIVVLSLFKSDSIFFSITMIIMAVVFMLLPLEMLAKLYLSLNPTVSNWWQDYMIDDDLIHHRMLPNAIDHDSNGWRNPTALDNANIVVIGDSQTWGSNVSRDEAWAMVLGDTLDDSVYSLAQPAYGVADYYTLFNHEALALNPQMIIIGLYFGNDLVDTTSRVYDREGYQAWRDTQIDTARLAESEQEIISTIERERQVWIPPETEENESLWLIVRDTTNIGRLLYRLNLWSDFTSNTSIASLYDNLPINDPHRFDIYSDDSQAIYFYPRIRSAVMDLDYSAVTEGNRLAHDLLADMQSTANTYNIDFVSGLYSHKRACVCQSCTGATWRTESFLHSFTGIRNDPTR